MARFSLAEVQHAVQSLAVGREIAAPALRDVDTYCDEAALHGQGSRDAVHFLGRALETAAIASAVSLFADRYVVEAGDKCKLRQLLAQRGPEVLREVAQWMGNYASALPGHAAHTRRVTHNLTALRRARGDVYRMLLHTMREQRPPELVQQRRRKLRGAASMPYERSPASAVEAGAWGSW
ncbi:hypothetical protein WJX81_008572 [Elliptochloris bilobata]|uniref:Uncharacterized protein n=1 Tax=Elliptochloris bilobata TaxID=381761 RepID=A0AAW1QY97_9CHLO